jgi:hypothetical protein
MHVNTTRKYLAKNEYYTFRPRRMPYLTETHKKERLRWARIYKDWELENRANAGHEMARPIARTKPN